MKKYIVYANISIPILAGSLLYYVTSPQVMFVQNIDRLLGASDKTGSESDNVVMVGGSFEKDGLKGTVNDADTDFTDYDDPYGFYKPGDGKKYVKADFSFENNGKSDAYVSSADFSCYADNESCDQSFIASVNEFSGDTLSTGRKISFSVVFAVPVDAESIELEYTTNIWSSEKVIIKLQ